jgi:hypothetical protein
MSKNTDLGFESVNTSAEHVILKAENETLRTKVKELEDTIQKLLLEKAHKDISPDNKPSAMTS